MTNGHACTSPPFVYRGSGPRGRVLPKSIPQNALSYDDDLRNLREQLREWTTHTLS